MMRLSEILLIARNEFTCFKKSDKGIFLIYLLIIISWGSLFSRNIVDITTGTGLLWLLFFSVIVNSNFANSSFVSERANGLLEIVLVSGLDRTSILLGKVLFVTTMSLIMGILCYAVSVIIASNLLSFDFSLLNHGYLIKIVLIYTLVSAMNSMVSAWLSIRISNPRLLYFANLLILVIIAVTYSVIDYFVGGADILFVLLISFLILIFFYLAQKEYKSDRVVKPVVY